MLHHMGDSSHVLAVCICAAGSCIDYQPSLSPSAFYSGFLQGFGSKDNFEPVLFNGLRVRMGVVTGEVPSGTSIKNSAMFQLAKGKAPATAVVVKACVKSCSVHNPRFLQT